MMLSIGNDIVENSRIQEAFEKHRDRFLYRIFSPDEISYCLSKSDPVPHLAGRFACKEAFVKALELDSGEVLDFKEVELGGTSFGKKKLVIHGKALDIFQRKGFHTAKASLSHTENYSTAVVLLIGDTPE